MNNYSLENNITKLLEHGYIDVNNEVEIYEVMKYLRLNGYNLEKVDFDLKELFIKTL